MQEADADAEAEGDVDVDGHLGVNAGAEVESVCDHVPCDESEMMEAVRRDGWTKGASGSRCPCV